MSIAFDELESLNEAIAKVTNELKDTEPGTDEFAKLSEQLSKVTQIKQTLVTLMLKKEELANKAREFEESHNLKAAEQTAKRTEVETSNSLKERELDLRRMEMMQRENDLLEAHALKKRELDLKQADAEKPDRVSKETWALIGANLAGIVAVLGYERANVIASKAFGLVFRR